MPEAKANVTSVFLQELDTISSLMRQPLPAETLKELKERVALLSYFLENHTELQESLTGDNTTFAYPANRKMQDLMELWKPSPIFFYGDSCIEQFA